MLVMLVLFTLGADPAPPVNLPAPPQDWPAETRQAVEEYAKSAEAFREFEIRVTEMSVASLPKLRATTTAAKKDKVERLADAKRRLTLLKAGVIFPQPNLAYDEAKAGQIGVLQQEGKVIVNKIRWSEHVTLRVKQIVNDRVIAAGPKRDIALLGLDLTDLADGSEITPMELFRCVGAKTYPTVDGGTQTLITYAIWPHADKVAEWEQLRIKAWEEQQPTKKEPVKKKKV